MARRTQDRLTSSLPARGKWLGIITFFVGVTLLAPPISVVYQANDESRRTSTLGADENVWATFYKTPPLSVNRFTYLALRSTAMAAAVNALFLCGVGVIAVRARALPIRLLGVFAIAEICLMLAMVLAAHRFAVELDTATAGRSWYLGKPYGSATRGTALIAALPGVTYSLVLLYLFKRHQQSRRSGTRL